MISFCSAQNGLLLAGQLHRAPAKPSALATPEETEGTFRSHKEQLNPQASSYR